MPRKRSDRPQVRREVHELSLLYELSQALDRSMDLREVVQPVLKALADHMGMTRGTLTLLNRKTGEIYIEAAHGLSPSQRERGRYRPGEGVTGKVVQTGKPAIVPRISEEPMFLDRTGARKGVRKRDISFICVPIKIGKEVVGTLSADRLFAEPVSLAEDVRLLSIVASMIAQAVRLRREAEEEHEQLLAENERLQNELRERFRPSNIIGTSSQMQEVYDLIARVSESDATVLIRGESGTGKELVANAIHYSSRRANKPLIKVNCAALPETLLESELFGHERGAFTGATGTRKGRFELANGGTLFLDEVGDFSPQLQLKLLRVLQERAFERVGGSTTIKVDVRVIAATNRNLEELIDAGQLRQDFYYRLNVFPIHLPPLRERGADVLLLANFFLDKYAKQYQKPVRRISRQATDLLMAYHWPGNVRELENCIERAVLMASDDVILPHHLPATLQPSTAFSLSGEGRTLQDRLESVECDMIVKTLESTKGNMAKAARILGITERVMGLRVKKYGIDLAQFRGKRGAIGMNPTKM